MSIALDRVLCIRRNGITKKYFGFDNKPSSFYTPAGTISPSGWLVVKTSSGNRYYPLVSGRDISDYCAPVHCRRSGSSYMVYPADTTIKIKYKFQYIFGNYYLFVNDVNVVYNGAFNKSIQLTVRVVNYSSTLYQAEKTLSAGVTSFDWGISASCGSSKPVQIQFDAEASSPYRMWDITHSYSEGEHNAYITISGK